MKVISVILALVVVDASVPINESEWSQFKLAHDKIYNDPIEEEWRLKIFNDNIDKINRHNELFKAGLETYEMGVTQFADMTQEEFEEYLTLSGPNPFFDTSEEVYDPPADLVLPKSIDYRTKKAVNPVKNQLSCGSCWAFSAVGALESLNYLKTKKLLSLSEQNLVDCSSKYGNGGCSGGLMTSAYNYIKDNGLQSEKGYPYTAKNGKCKFDKKKSVIKVKGYQALPKGNEVALQTAIANVGPITVGVDASQFHLYKSGIFSVNKWNQINHGVVAVGYGEEKGKQYYIVRNSWGKAWGEQGYIRIARNKQNQVGISSMACYPKL